MINTIQDLLISILNLFQKPSQQLSLKLKERVIFLSFLFLNIWTMSYAIFKIRFAIIFFISGMVMLPIMLCCLEFPLKTVLWRKSLSIPWMIFAGIAFLSAFIVTYHHLLNGIAYLILFPVFWFILSNNKNIERLFYLYAKSMVMVFAIMLFISLLFFPPFRHDYHSFIGNTNGFAQILTVVFPCLLFLCSYNLKKSTLTKKRTILLLVLITYCIGLLFMSTSRTGIFSFIAIFIVWAVYIILKNRNNIKKAVVSVACIFIIAVISFYFTMLSFFITNKIMLNFSQPVEYTIHYLKISQDYILPEMDFIRLEQTSDCIFQKVERIESGDPRIDIWKNYFNKLSLLGNQEQFSTGKRLGGTAHMAPLQYAYDYGIIAGFAYNAFWIASGIYCLIFVFKKKNLTSLFAVMIAAGYCVTSLLASTDNPFTYHIVFAYLLVQVVVLERNRKKI